MANDDKPRACPGMRSCWSFRREAYSLRTGGNIRKLLRRLTMYTILALDVLVIVLGLIWKAFGGKVLGIIIGVVFGIINLFFLTWCLAQIGEAEGTRRVLGMRIGRLHLDIFLLLVAVLFVLLFVGLVAGPFRTPGVSSSCWFILWLLIFAVAWISTWTPEGEQSAV